MNNGKIGRNEKCPCESNKKYKKCHGSDSLIDIEKASKGTLISENEANKLNLSIDWNERLAISQNNNFALVIHGGQPAGHNSYKIKRLNLVRPNLALE